MAATLAREGGRRAAARDARRAASLTLRDPDASLARVILPLAAIRDAARRTAPHLHRTPVFGSRAIGERAGAQVVLKAELFQKTGSFKPRGALNIVLALEPAQRAAGL